MNYNLKIAKTDVKVYDLNIDIDTADLKSWVESNMYTYKEFLMMNFFDDEKGELKSESEIDVSEDEFYNQYVDDYIEDLDLDQLWLENCHDHSEYQMENEECQLMEISLA